DLDMRYLTFGRARRTKGPALETLLHDAESVAVPEQDLGDVSAAVEKHKQVARHRLQPEFCLHQRGQTVEALARIHRSRRDEDLHARRQRQHIVPPSAASRTRASRARSKSSLTRTRRPLRRITSRSPEAELAAGAA